MATDSLAIILTIVLVALSGISYLCYKLSFKKRRRRGPPSGSTHSDIHNGNTESLTAGTHRRQNLDNRSSDVDYYISDARQALENNNYFDVLFYVDRCLEISSSASSQSELYLMKAEALAFIGRFSEAEKSVEKVLIDDSSNTETIYVRGLCFYLQGNLEEAIARLQTAAMSHKKAKVILEKAKRIQQLENEGSDLCYSGEFAEAAEKYTRALIIDPQNGKMNAKLYCKRADMYAKMNLREKVIEDCKKAIKLDSSCHEAFERRGTAYLEKGNYEKAVKNFRTLVKLVPSAENKERLDNAQTKRNLPAATNKNVKDYYKILEVSRDATEEDIKRAYRKMALIHHPDRHVNASEAEKNYHETMFKNLSTAYMVLIDPKNRSLHDSGRLIEEQLEKYGYNPTELENFMHLFNSVSGQYNVNIHLN